jgi:hypothetical protein
MVDDKQTSNGNQRLSRACIPLLKIEISLNCKNSLTFFWNSRKFELLLVKHIF